MIQNRLRIYCGPDESDTTPDLAGDTFSRPSIPMAVEELVSVLNDAMRNRRAWLDDFKDDEILVSPDLYEVILAYQHYHRPSA